MSLINQRKSQNSFFTSYFDELRQKLSSASDEKLSRAAEVMIKVKGGNKKVILVGNGGSASICAHVAVDLIKCCGIKAVTFNEPNLITCFANDYGYELWH